jgi:hypothetical protein
MKVSREVFERRIAALIDSVFSSDVAEILKKHRADRKAVAENGCPVCREVCEHGRNGR